MGGVAHAAIMYFEPGFKGGMGTTVGAPCWNHNDISGKYCTCSGSAFTTVSCSSYSRRVTYTSINTNHSGTASDPYVLTGCAHDTCTCSSLSYWTGSTCAACAKSPATNIQTHGSAGEDHNNTTCSYCGEDNYKDVFNPAPGVNIDACYPCPNNGKKASSTGGITECCLDANMTATDDTGTYTCTSKSCYVK